MSTRPPRGRKREHGTVGRPPKRLKRDNTFEHSAFCTELFVAIKNVRDADGRPITDTLQRAPSRRNEPDYYNIVEKAIDLSRINQKVNAEEYNSFEEICGDIELLVRNTISFYKPETIEHQHALALQNVYNTEKERILQQASGERPDSSNERLSSTPSTASTSVKREASLPPEEWRMEAVVSSILREHDRDGRLLCPPFRILVSPEDFPMYYQVIKEPIDLQKIANKIRNNEYTSWTDFGNDLRLMYQNAKQFNESNSSIYKDAVYLNNFTKQRLHFFSNAKKPSAVELDRYKVMVNDLLTKVFGADEGDGGTSEDSNDEEITEESDNALWKLYSKVRHSEHAEQFLVLPDRRLYPDYYEDEDITSPVSIFLINSRLKKGRYESLVGLINDLQLMVRNAMVYNIEGSVVYESAAEIDSLIIHTAKELDPSLEIKPTVVESEKLTAPQPKTPGRKPRAKKVQVEEEEDEDYQIPEEEVSQPLSDSINESSLMHKPSIGSDDGTNLSDVNSVVGGTPRKKKNRGVPPSRLPGAAETRAQLIPKRSKKNTTGERMRPGRKSFNELRELYKAKLLEIYRTVHDFKISGRQVCAEFMFRPDPNKYSDYYNVIENPIDMVTMKHRIENGEYQTSETFMDDWRLLFSNARKFNHPDSQIYADANQLENLAMNTMMKITNNTVLRYPPPSKRTPNFFSSEVGSPTGQSSTPTISVPKSRSADKAVGEKTPGRMTVQQVSPLQIKMSEVLDRICDVQSPDGRKLSTMFQKLPSKAEYPDYYNVIRKPMDLARIRQKLDNNQYETQRNFFADLKLVFENACKFNEPDSQIYKDALTLQQEIIEICAEDTEDEKGPSVQSQVRRILTNLLVSVNNYTERGRCLSNSFTEVTELFRKNGIFTKDMPFTLDQIKINMDKNRYRRLDRFQDDVFALFSKVRAISRPESQLFLDSIDLQKFFISKREELCKGVLVSPAGSFTESDLWDEIEARRKAFKKEKSPNEATEIDSDADPTKAMEVDESEKPKESEEIMECVEFNEIIYKPKDYVYVGPGEDSSSNDNQKHIFRIESIARDADNKEVILVRGLWIFRPSETYHLSKRKFYKKEVFLTPNKGSVTLDRLLGKCCVLYLDDYLKYKPIEFDDEDIYVCEFKYLGRRLHFKRFNAWPYQDEIQEMAKEDRPEDFNPQRTMTSEFVSRENSVAPVQKTETVDDDGDMDERMKNLPPILDVHREEIPMRRRNNKEEEPNEDSLQGEESKEILYFEQVCLNGTFYRVGDCVLVFHPKKGHCDVMQISRIWETPQGRFFSGTFFARPKEVTHDSSTCFYKREVIAVEQPERVEPLERIQSRCAILTVKQFTVCRPTEVPECDVFVVDHKVNGDPRAQGFMTYVSHKNYRKMKTYSWSDNVPDDEIYYFKSALTMERKEPSPLVSKMDTTLPVDPVDIDGEERHVSEQIENPNASKDMSWLANAPKLNAKSKSGYILFSAEVRKRIMSENPEAGFGEVSKMVGVEWKKLTDEQKRQYESRASFIAEERAKNDLLTPNSKVLQPGEIRIFVCRWHGCDYQFDNYDGLFDHVKTSHASSEETRILDSDEIHYGCHWMTCVKYRANGKPFPTLPRLLRHIREKHMPASGKVIMPNQRGKHFFQYIPSKESSTKDNPQGMFVCQPNGVQVPNAVAHRTAIPLDAKQPSLPTSPVSTTSHSISSSTPGPSNHAPPATPISHHPPGTTSQIYHVQHTSQSHATSQPTQIVQVVNGSSVAYVNSPYQTVIVNQPVSGAHHQVVTSTGQPTGQILVQHAVGHSTPHQIVVHGAPATQSSQPSTIIQPGQGYAQHSAPGPVHIYGSGTPSHAPPSAVPYYTPGSHQAPPSQHYQIPAGSVQSTPPPQQQMSHVEAARTIVTAGSRPEPLFIPPPNSIKVKHVLHSEVYLRYIESLSQGRQKTVSNYDKSLQQNQFNTRVDRRKLPTEWIDKSGMVGKKREDEICQALWRLRDNMLESVVGIRRDVESL